MHFYSMSDNTITRLLNQVRFNSSKIVPYLPVSTMENVFTSFCAGNGLAIMTYLDEWPVRTQYNLGC